jgi:hypothetical protein
MERLTVPKDDPAPDTPFEVFLQGELEAGDPDHALGANLLGTCQIRRVLREEELVAPLLGTSAVLL